MLKKVLTLAIPLTLTLPINAETYNVLIKKNEYDVTVNDWVNVGSEYDCKNYNPLDSEIEYGTVFTQAYNCQQDQSISNGGQTQTRTITVDYTQESVGTMVYKSCLEILQAGYTTSGEYTINPTGNEEFPAYCDMTTDGGGWTLVYYSNSNSVSRDMLSAGDWSQGPSVNFSRLHSFKDIKRNNKYEFFIHDSSTIFRNVIFNQTNSYLENPNGNSYTQTGGNFYYSSQASGWQGLSLGNYGNSAMVNHCSLSMSYDGSSWTYCLQDQYSTNYNTGPWFYESTQGGYDEGSQQWVKIYQR